MKKYDVVMALGGVREAFDKWDAARKEFNSNIDFVMARLLREAAANMMSVADVSIASGLNPRQVRARMRMAGLDPKKSKTLLAKNAAEALAENSELMGIEPHEMDLTSPLAYLPMGAELKQRLIDARVHRVTELPPTQGPEVAISFLREVSGNENVPMYLRAEADQVLGDVFGIQE